MSYRYNPRLRAKVLHGGYAEKLGWGPDRFDQRQLKIGTKHELEHTNDRELARGIAMDHLAEQVLKGEPQDYYDRIAKLEANRSHSELLSEWRQLVNMTPAEIQDFLERPEGRSAGMTRQEADRQGLRSGQDAARAILHMKQKDPQHWTFRDWDWAQRQVNFIRRMSGMRGELWDPRGRPTRKLLSLMLWGHLPDEVLELYEQERTRREGHQPVAAPRRRFHENRATHPFRALETEWQRRRRASSDQERSRHAEHRYLVAGVDQKGRDWLLGSSAEIDRALSKARSQRVYPRAVVIDSVSGEIFE